MKTWDVLDRRTGKVVVNGSLSGESPDVWRWKISGLRAMDLTPREVAYCRETGEVVYR